TQHVTRVRALAGTMSACLVLFALHPASAAKSAKNSTKATAASTATVTTGLENVERQVTDFTLPNGLKFILLERHDAPVFSFETRVNAGGAQEVPGTTGIAHMMEHMAFKGTERVGTKDFAAEAPLLDKEEKSWQAVLAERQKAHVDSSALNARMADYKAAREAARSEVVSNGFGTLLEQNGAVGLNAQTSSDWTRYFYSLPSNRLEFWGAMEAGRIAFPVFREFYKERDVVYEERR